MVKIGIMSFAHMHAYSYAKTLMSIPGVELAGVADEDPVRGTDASKQFGTKYFESYESLLGSDIDGVIICSENSKHAGLTLAAAKHKKHVLCEKPISTNMQDGKRMIDACSHAGVELRIAFPSRFSPAAGQLREMVMSGRLGSIVAVRCTNRGQMPGGWFIEKDKAGGGALMDHTVHVVDLIRWFLDKEITKVYAEKGTLLHDIGIDDCGLLSMELEGGVFATLDTSWSRPRAFPSWGDLTMEIVGTKGVGYLDKSAQNIIIHEQDLLTTRYENWGTNSDYYLIEGFVKILRGEEHPLATGWDGLKAMEVALAAYKSSEEHKPVLL